MKLVASANCSARRRGSSVRTSASPRSSLKSVKVAKRPSCDANTTLRPSIWLTFHPSISSPICARTNFLSAPARTTARAPSPSITTPKRTRLGGGGGGAGGSAACTIGGGAGGGAGGRRVGENSGRSSIVDSWSSDCAATGLEGAAAAGPAPRPSRRRRASTADRSKRTKMSLAIVHVS